MYFVCMCAKRDQIIHVPKIIGTMAMAVCCSVMPTTRFLCFCRTTFLLKGSHSCLFRSFTLSGISIQSFSCAFSTHTHLSLMIIITTSRVASHHHPVDTSTFTPQQCAVCPLRQLSASQCERLAAETAKEREARLQSQRERLAAQTTEEREARLERFPS